MGFKFNGLAEFKRSLERLRDEADRATKEEIRNHMDKLLLETRELVPKATGLLASTGHVEEIPLGYQIVYGNSGVNDDSPGVVDYAAAVHEIEEHHHVPPTQAKYVQEPLEASAERLAERVAKRYERILE